MRNLEINLNPSIWGTIMNPAMTFKEYFAELRGRENEGASLKALLDPFKISGVPETEDEFIMVGHILDAIAEEKGLHDGVDAAYVLDVAIDLGLIAS